GIVHFAVIAPGWNEDELRSLDRKDAGRFGQLAVITDERAPSTERSRSYGKGMARRVKRFVIRVMRFRIMQGKLARRFEHREGIEHQVATALRKTDAKMDLEFPREFTHTVDRGSVDRFRDRDVLLLWDARVCR